MDKDRLISHIQDIAIKQELKKILDIAQRAMRSHTQKNTKFLTPNILSLVEPILRGLDVNYKITGLFEEAERQIIYFFPYYEEVQSLESVLSIIKITPYQEDELSHRDYLGSIVGLGIERENIGDIVFDNQHNAYVVVLNPLDEFILSSLTKVRHTKVDVQRVDDLPDIEPSYDIRTINIASLRLDSIVAGLLNLSREKAQRIVQSGDVRVNFAEEKNNAKTIPFSAILSIRGYGKFKLLQLISETKKNRLRIEIAKYNN